MSGFLRKLRHRIRASRKQARLLGEQASYHRRFAAEKLSIPDEATIRSRVRRRWPGLKPRRKGELRILSIFHSYNWEGPSLAPALAAFGEVRHIDWRDPQLAGGKAHESRGWMEQMHAGVLAQIRAWAVEKPFDVVFTYLSGEQCTPAFMQQLRDAARAPMINLALNDKEAFVGRVRGGHAAGARDICRYYDLCWTSTEDALEKYVVEGAMPLYLPEGANPGVHKPYPGHFKYDVSFVGQCYGNRPEVIAALRGAGIPVEAFGPGWPNGPLSTEDMVRTWSRSRINLGFGGVSDFKNTFCLKGRDFEVPMSGGLYITEHHDELPPFYRIGEELVTYTGMPELIEKIRWLLANPEAAQKIRAAGHARAMAEHSWEGRFEKVFRLVGALQ